MTEKQEKILAFDNQFHEFNSQIVEGVTGIVTPFPLIVEGINRINHKLTGQEIREIISSIQVGAEWAYPDKSQQILFNFMKGLIMADLCQDIADCIENPTSPAASAVTNISEEITNSFVTENNYLVTPDRELEPQAPDFIEKRFKAIDRDFPVLPDGGTCNNARKDEIFGGVLEIVNRLSEMAQDMLEDLNAQADSVQRAARTVAIIPLLGDVAGETILAFAEVVPDLLNLYLSHDSIEQRELVACDLFCLHADTCQYPTFDEILEYYKSLGISGLDDITAVSLQAFIDAVIGTNGLAASVVWHAVNTLVLYVLYAQGTFLGRRGTKWLQIYAGNGELVPNDDWLILCECGVQQKVWDFSLGSELGWRPQVTGDGDRAVWSGNGWIKRSLFYGNVIVIENPFTWPTNLDIQRITVQFQDIVGASFKISYTMPYATRTGTLSPFESDKLVDNLGYNYSSGETGFGVEFSIFEGNPKIIKIIVDYQGTEPTDW